MDSLTQAVLGAACGEAVLGRKIGNKALVWGAIAGTIPDLDVVSQVFLNHEVEELIYHRGFTHSILFTVFGALLLGWMAKNARPWLLTAFFLTIMVFVGNFAIKTPGVVTIGIAAVFAAVGGLLSRRWFDKKYNVWEQEPSFAEWSIMFFFGILTHWFIDACTSYGTQIFEPFSSYRISFNNIAIVDPLYTLPLLIFILILRFYKDVRVRTILNWTGILLSSGYMAFSFYAKSLANDAFTQSLKEQKIEYKDFISYPTIFNTLLWQITVRSEDAYYFGIYSIMDEKPEIEFIKLPKNHELLDKYKDERYVKILKWFAQGYYNVEEKGNGELQINNLRFGLMGFGLMKDLEDPYIFKFRVGMKDGKLEAWPMREDLEKIDVGEAFSVLWTRMWGGKIKEER